MAIVLEDGKSTQIISVMGLPQCDIAYYLARAFNAIKKTVLVVDNSRYHELFKSIPNPDNEKMVQTGDIYYIENIKYSEEFFAQYDFVIVYHGMDIRDELNAASDYRYLITDYSPITTERLRTELDRQEDTLKYHIIYRNKVSGKIQEKMILQELGIPEKLVFRQPFPGPGLGIRIIGEVTEEKVKIVQDADAIYREEIAKAGLDREINQYFAALTNMRSVGVMGDFRTYDYAVALRAVKTIDFMTAEASEIPYEVLNKVMNRIINEVKGVNRVMYDLTSKPPGTIEFE